MMNVSSVGSSLGVASRKAASKLVQQTANLKEGGYFTKYLDPNTGKEKFSKIFSENGHLHYINCFDKEGRSSKSVAFYENGRVEYIEDFVNGVSVSTKSIIYNKGVKAGEAIANEKTGALMVKNIKAGFAQKNLPKPSELDNTKGPQWFNDTYKRKIYTYDYPSMKVTSLVETEADYVSKVVDFLGGRAQKVTEYDGVNKTVFNRRAGSPVSEKISEEASQRPFVIFDEAGKLI